LEIPCGNCGAELRLNPNLAGLTVSCPSCGAAVVVPKASRERAPEPGPAERPRPPRRFTRPYTLWLLGAQTALLALALSCLAGVFFRNWPQPEWSYLRESRYVLLGAGLALLLAVWAAYHLPVLVTLAAALAAIGACASRYAAAGAVDASRSLALSVAMLALWLALAHRRATR
jgi:hypothetical protein